MKVKATDKFIKDNIRPQELDYKPEPGQEFEVTKERYMALEQKGYIESIIEEKEIAVNQEKKETAIKKTTPKKPTPRKK